MIDESRRHSVFNSLDLRDTVSLTGRARRLLGWGATSIDIRPLFFGDILLPHFAAAVSGCELTDTNGRRYIDWFGGSCNLLGYREPRVEEAIRAQMAAGPILPFMHRLEVEVAEQLVAMIPCAEMVAFGKNGSDGVTAAVRLARMTTGRDIILHYGYHGFHDWFADGALVHPFVYNDVDNLRELLGRFDGRVAAVVMEPVRDEMPAPGYLESVRQLTREAGCLLIFDEVMTALRLGAGGAQEAFGVIPDLACLGKCMGNGMPLSAVVGSRELMRDYPRTEVGMTFQGETLSLAAARTVLRIVRDEPVAQHIAGAGQSLRAAFDADTKRLGVEAALTGHPARPVLSFAGRGEFPGQYLLGVFQTECLRRGVIAGQVILPSYAHDDAAVERTAAVFGVALEFVARAVEAPFRGWILPGEPEVIGYLDRVDGEEASGWMLVNGGAADTLRAFTLDGQPIEIVPANRQDVARVHAGAESSGFVARVNAGTGLLIEATRGAATARCIVDWSGATLPLALQQGRVSTQ